MSIRILSRIVLEYLVMGQDLKHLALVVDDTRDAGTTATSGLWVKEVAGHFVRMAVSCLQKLPALECLSFFYPELQTAISEKQVPPVEPEVFTRAMSAAAAALAEQDAALSLLGFPDLLPPRWASLLGAVAPPFSAGRSVHFYLGYSGREEVVRAAEAVIAAGLSSVEAEEIDRRLLAAGVPEPDLIIFCSRDFTPRDFMIWQSSYAEIWHASLPGTACSANDIQRALDAYGRRERRFGKV